MPDLSAGALEPRPVDSQLCTRCRHQIGRLSAVSDRGVGLHPGDDATAISPSSIGDGAVMLDSGVGACKLAAVCMMLFTTRFLVVTRREGVSEGY